MLPFSSDPDSNFELEVDCTDGKFVRPSWPNSCVPRQVCRGADLPNPPSAAIPLVRLDNKAEVRADEFAYFGCQDPEAVLNDNSGMNVYQLPCIETQSDPVWDPNWPECYLEPTCTNLAEPAPTSGMQRATEGDKVKLGDYVVYECTRRDEFFEVSTVSEISVDQALMRLHDDLYMTCCTRVLKSASCALNPCPTTRAPWPP